LPPLATLTEFCLTEAARVGQNSLKDGLKVAWRASSCFFNSLSELGLLLTRAFAFVPVERSLRARVGLFAPLRDKVTSSAQSLVPLCAHRRLRTAQESYSP